MKAPHHPRSTSAFLLQITFAAALAIGAFSVRTAQAQAREPIMMELQLVDGSRLLVTTELISLKLQAAAGELSIPLASVGGFQVKPDHKTLAVSLLNGDVFSGTTAWQTLKLNSLLGEHTVPLSKIDSLHVLKRNATSEQAEAEGTLLTSPGGRRFVAEQLSEFDVDPEGVIATHKAGTINLNLTEGRSFELTGQVKLGGSDFAMSFPQDLPDGFALFIREVDGLHRYQVDSRRVWVKRRMLGGAVLTGFATPVQFAVPESGVWLPFRLRVTPEEIEYSFGKQSGKATGPVSMDGSNKIVIAPGTQLRSVRIKLLEPATAEPAP